MLHIRPAEQVSAGQLAEPGAWAAPACSIHAGSVVRPYRTLGPNGPGVYPQCLPRGGEAPHLLSWERASKAPAPNPPMPSPSPSELDVLRDAARGLTVAESAASRTKSPETVKSQRKQVMLKLGARNMTHAVVLAAVDGLIELERAA